jgi:hypothetical protein
MDAMLKKSTAVTAATLVIFTVSSCGERSSVVRTVTPTTAAAVSG